MLGFRQHHHNSSGSQRHKTREARRSSTSWASQGSRPATNPEQFRDPVNCTTKGRSPPLVHAHVEDSSTAVDSWQAQGSTTGGGTTQLNVSCGGSPNHASLYFEVGIDEWTDPVLDKELPNARQLSNESRSETHYGPLREATLSDSTSVKGTTQPTASARHSQRHGRDQTTARLSLLAFMWSLQCMVPPVALSESAPQPGSSLAARPKAILHCAAEAQELTAAAEPRKHVDNLRIRCRPIQLTC